MTDDDGSHTQLQANRDKNNQHGHSQNNFRDDDGDVDHQVDKLFGHKIKPIEANTAQHADDYTDHRDDQSDDDRVDQGIPQIHIFKAEKPDVPICGKALPVIIALGVVEGKDNHDSHGQIKNAIDKSGINPAKDVSVLVFLLLIRHLDRPPLALFSPLFRPFSCRNLPADVRSSEQTS